MKINKCKSCKHYDSFFNSCNLYYNEVYLGEGSFEYSPVGIKNITTSECEYEVKNDRQD